MIRCKREGRIARIADGQLLTGGRGEDGILKFDVFWQTLMQPSYHVPCRFRVIIDNLVLDRAFARVFRKDTLPVGG